MTAAQCAVTLMKRPEDPGRKRDSGMSGLPTAEQTRTALPAGFCSLASIAISAAQVGEATTTLLLHHYQDMASHQPLPGLVMELQKLLLRSTV